MNDNQKLMNKQLDEKVELLNKTMDYKIEMLRVNLNRDLVDKKQHNEVNIEANANKNIEPKNKFDDFQEQMEADSKAGDIIVCGVPYATGENHQLLYARTYRPLSVSVLLFLLRVGACRLDRKKPGLIFDSAINTEVP
jgi:hypothetical protein